MIPANLHYIINKLGHTSLEVSGKYSSNSWMPWKKVLYLTHLTPLQWKKYTERTIAPCEVVLDYDEYHCTKCNKLISNLKCSYCNRKHSYLKRKSLIRKRVRQIILRLDERNYKYKAYKTGGKGYHIFLVFPELLFLSPFQQRKYKSKIIKLFGAELMKATNRVMIMREGSKHRRTGKKKVLIKERRGVNWGLLDWCGLEHLKRNTKNGVTNNELIGDKQLK